MDHAATSELLARNSHEFVRTCSYLAHMHGSDVTYP